ncbi:MAG: stage II sporulation protein R [Ruminococcaceae bacterium]|nr:stage II sporulation protein R [Oscillospiraceae bacterium]
MKVKIIGSICISFMIVFTILTILPVNGEAEIYDNMIRLHVLSNSDSREDQALKLKVRDAVLKKAESINAEDAAEAYIKTEESLEILKKAAEEKIREEGYSYPVSVTLGKERYPEREYDGFTLPAGEYTSLRVLIGEAEGKNWWCVLYPPLCTASASKREEVFIAAGFTEGQYEAITESENKTYKVKFKIVEILRELFA